MTHMPRSATSLLACVLAFAVSSAGADGLVLDYGYVDQKSAAYKRFKGWVDQAVGGNPGYEFSALDAVAMFRITGLGRYCDSAVRMVQAEVDEADARIADGQRPAVAGDSYLEVGPRIGALAQTFAACGERLSDGQRAQWTTYADRTIANVWNPKAARWGDTPAAWTGWSIDNPGNNYYYSFIEATMNWALASGNASWLAYLRNEKLPPLKAYYAELPGGGSLEGTGYGAAHMRLFALYRLWKDSTGEDLANASTHLSDSIRFWVHATMPTLDRFAPIGDQSRVSQPELYDYHRRLVLEARISSNDEGARAMARLADLCERGISPAVFPEGTRSRTGTVGRFNTGAVRIILERASLPVLSAAVDGGWKIGKLKGLMKNFGRTRYRIRLLALHPAPRGKREILDTLGEVEREIRTQMEAWRAEEA